MAGTDIAQLAFSMTEYRTVSAEDAAIKTRHPLAIDLEYNTFISNEADALSFGNNILNLLKVDRNTWQCQVAKGNYNFDLGDTITIVYPRFGLSGGKNFIIKRFKRDANGLFYDLTLFGPQ